MKQKSSPVVEKVQGEIEQTLADFGYELVQLKFGGYGAARTLTVLIDKPGGPTLADCRYMASRLSVLLDTLDPIEGRYTLAVSSPGVDRPLTRDSDFERFIDETVSVRAAQLDGKRQTREGTLKGVRDEQVCLLVGGEELLIPLADIEAARLVYDWDSDQPADE